MENLDLITLLVQLVSGALGGTIAGAILRNLSLGMLGDAIAGIIGGGIGGHLLTTILNLPAAAAAGADAGAIDPMAILGQVASGAGGGAVVMILIGILRSLFAK